MSVSPDSDLPVLNRSKNSINGRLNFELVGKCSRYQHVTYSQYLVRVVSQSTNIVVLTYRWHDRISKSHSQHKSVKDQLILIGYLQMKYPNLRRPDICM